MPKRKTCDSPTTADTKPAKAAKSDAPKLTKALIKLAEESLQSGSIISYAEAKQLWLKASDGHGVSMKEFATLEHILNTHKFTKKARMYLDSLVTKHESGTSMYKSMNKIRYDRSCLDLAAHLYKDGKIDVCDARLLWKDVEDGPGVTEVEKRTIEYVRDNYTLSEGAKKFFRQQLSAWRPRVSRAAASSASSPAATPAAIAAATPAAIAAAASGSSSSSSSLSSSSSSSSWHGSSGFSTPAVAAGMPVVSKHFDFNMGAKAYGLFVTSDTCYAGDESGLVVALSPDDGSVKQQFRLPSGVKCMVADGGFLFAGCNDGSLYDLTAGRPRLVAELEDFSQILWMDIHNGTMAASDAAGNVAMVNCEGETIWKRKSEGCNGWMVRVDDSGMYHGHSTGITKYNLEGTKQWHCPTEAVLFGYLQGDDLYASLIEPNCFDGEIAKRLERAGAKTGEVVASLMWNNRDDLDLHVYTPTGEHIYYGHKTSQCGGCLDVDMNAGGRSSDEPVENIYWDTAPAGHYRVSVIQYNNRTGDAEVPFEVHVNVRGEKKKIVKTFTRNGGGGLGSRREMVVYEFDVAPRADAMEDDSEAKQKKAVVKVDKQTGKISHVFAAGSSVPATTCSATQVYAAVPHGIMCFDGQGNESLWKLGTGEGNAMTMQHTTGDKLFAVCGSKVLCMDVSQASIDKAKAGQASSGLQRARSDAGDLEETTAVASSADLEVASDASAGVVVKCIKEGSRFRVVPEDTARFSSSKFIQFPRNVRAAGARFLVDGLDNAGSFYRVKGNIRRLAEEQTTA